MTCPLTFAGALSGSWDPSLVLPSSGLSTTIWLDPAADYIVVGGARLFASATSEGFTRADNAAFDFDTGDFMLSVWFYRTTAGNQCLIGKYEDANNYYKLECDASNKLHFIAVKGGVTKIEATGTTAVSTTAQWYHAAVKVDRSAAATTYIYLDAADDTSGTPTVSTDDIANTGAFWLGQDGNSGIYWNGRMARVLLCKLTDSTAVSDFVSTTHADGNGVTYSDLTSTQVTDWGVSVAYDLMETTGNAIDSHTGGLDLTDTNTVTAANGPSATNVADETSNDNDGTLVNFANPATAFKPDVPSAISGDQSWSLEFDGSNDYVQIANSADFDITSFTISAWLKLSAKTGYDTIFRNGAGGNGFFLNAGKMIWYQGADRITGSTSLSTGQWYHVCLTSDAANLNVYLDGSSDATEVAYAADLSNAGAQFIGRDSASNPLAGKIADVRVYNAELSAAQVAELAAGNDPTGAGGNLVGHWRLDDGAAGTPSDGDYVVGWRTRTPAPSGPGYLFSQDTASKRPVWNAADSNFNSKPTLTGDGSDDVLQSSGVLSLLTGSAGGIYLCARAASAPTNTDWLLTVIDAAGSRYLYVDQRGNDGELRVVQRNNDTMDVVHTPAAVNFSDNNAHIATVQSTGTAYELRLDGADVVEEVSGGANTGDWFADTDNLASCDLLGLGLLGGYGWDGEVATILIFDGGDPTADADTIEGWLNKEYSVY